MQNRYNTEISDKNNEKNKKYSLKMLELFRISQINRKRIHDVNIKVLLVWIIVNFCQKFLSCLSRATHQTENDVLCCDHKQIARDFLFDFIFHFVAHVIYITCILLVDYNLVCNLHLWKDCKVREVSLRSNLKNKRRKWNRSYFVVHIKRFMVREVVTYKETLVRDRRHSFYVTKSKYLINVIKPFKK